MKFVTADTPARYSEIKFNDEIIIWGLIKNEHLETGILLTDIKLQQAVMERKTLVLVLKRSK